LREDSLEKWDIVVAAPWLQSNDKKAYALVIAQIQSALTTPELVQFSRVVVLDDTDPVVSFFSEDLFFDKWRVQRVLKRFFNRSFLREIWFCYQEGLYTSLQRALIFTIFYNLIVEGGYFELFRDGYDAKYLQ
jgi:hypothetical protein